MVSVLYKNENLAKNVSKFVDAARILCNNGFALGRCGAMFLEVTDFMTEDGKQKVSISPEFSLPDGMESLKDRFFYTTSLHCSLEQYVKTPM